MTRASFLALVLALAPGCAHQSATERFTDVDFEEEAPSYPASPAVQAAEQMLVEGRLRSAREALDAVLESTPDDPRALLDLGLVLELGGDTEGSERAYRRAIEVAPRFPEALNNLALLLRDRGEPAEAEALLRRAIEARPRYVDAHVNLATVLEDLGRADDALASYRTAARLAPNDPLPRLGLAFLLLSRGDRDAARLELMRARAHANDDAELLRDVGRGLREVGDLEASLRTLEAAVEHEDPHTASTQTELALVYVELRRGADAEAAARNAVRLDPEDAFAWLVLGRVLAARDADREAADAFRRASTLDDGDVARRARDALDALRR